MNPNPTPNRASQRPNRNKNQHRLRRAISYVAVVALIALIAFGLRPQPPQVELVRASVGTLRATVNEEGKTRIKHRFTVAAPVPGQLRRIELKPGAEVREGETVVAVIDPLSPTLLDARSRQLGEARRETAVANLEKARASHKFEVSELWRLEQLHQQKVVAFRELETAQARETVAAKEVAAAESALQQVEAELADFSAKGGNGANSTRSLVEVKAPADGRVLRVLEESSRVVGAGMPLLEVGDPTDLEIVIEVLSRDGAVIEPGMKIDLEQWGDGRLLAAVVRLVEPQAFTKISALGVEEQRVRVIADLVTPPAERRSLGDSFRVEARVVVWQTERALKVPAGALFRRGQQWFAFVVSAGRARLRSVTVGHSSGSEMQILDGLKEGEALVLYPGDRIKDGARVRPMKI